MIKERKVERPEEDTIVLIYFTQVIPTHTHTHTCKSLVEMHLFHYPLVNV